MFSTNKSNPSTITVKIFIPDDPTQKQLVAACEKIVSYMLLDSKKNFKDFEENYYQVLDGNPVGITVNRDAWKDCLIAFKVIDSDGRESYLMDVPEGKIDGKIGVCTGGMDERFHIGRGKLVSSSKVQKPCIEFLTQVLLDLGRSDLLDDWNLPTSTKVEPADNAEATRPTRAESAAQREVRQFIADFKVVTGNVVTAVCIPTEVSSDERQQGERPLVEVLYSLGQAGRKEYVNQIEDMIERLTVYRQTVSGLSDQLDRKEDPKEDSKEARVREVQNLFKCGRERALAIIAQADNETAESNSQSTEPEQDTDDEAQLAQPEPKKAEQSEVYVNAKKYYNALVNAPDINELDIPEQLVNLAEVNARVPFSKIESILEGLCYSSGEHQGKAVKFDKPRQK